MGFGTDVPHHSNIPSFQWLAPGLAVAEGRLEFNRSMMFATKSESRNAKSETNSKLQSRNDQNLVRMG